jgi:hypothetical protein
MTFSRSSASFAAVGASIVFLAAAATHAFGNAESAPREGGKRASVQTPGCEADSPKQCLERALTAMGGRERLAALRTVRLDVIGSTLLTEQSYRQAPFITSYERRQTSLDLAGGRLIENQHVVWPESDLNKAELDQTLIVTPSGGVYHGSKRDSPCGGASVDAAHEALALGPERVLLTADNAADLHFLAPETLRSTSHTVLAFTWNGLPVRILLNQHNHLPDAIETMQEFRDFWFFWGDVQQRVYFDNWRLVHGVEYPSNQVVERNGVLWRTSQALNIEFNVDLAEKDFAVDAKAAALSLQAKGWKRQFHADHDQQLAPGIDVFEGSWNATIVKQSDGVVLLETPISGTFTQGLFEEAKRRYPESPIKAVLSTSDSWPHVGGIRFDVAQRVPVYILDLNQPLLDHMVAAPHTLDPDPLQASKRMPIWRIVSGKTEIGTGENRIQLFPLRGASTERQYMVYFPERRLLYASDTLVLNDDNSLYDPELVSEVEQAVEREHLAVDTVFAMHQAPMAWKDVVALLQKART